MAESTPSRLDIDLIVRRCSEESRNFFQGLASDDRFCYELFRRAVVARNTYAWEAIYHQYRNLVSGWLRRSSGFSALEGDQEELINAVFTRFWRSLDGGKFQRFPTLQTLLRYLQLCAGSTVTDRLRRHRHDHLLESYDQLTHSPTGAPVEAPVLDEVERAHFWQRVNGLLNDEQEITLVYGCFVQGLKPRQIYEQYNQHFTGIEDVYRVKRNVVNRLRRTPELKSWWGSGDIP